MSGTSRELFSRLLDLTTANRAISEVDRRSSIGRSITKELAGNRRLLAVVSARISAIPYPSGALIDPSGDWSHRAMCRSMDPSDFMLSVGQSASPRARIACVRCRVKQDCLDSVMKFEDDQSYRAFTTFRVRRELRKTFSYEVSDPDGVSVEIPERAS